MNKIISITFLIVSFFNVPAGAEGKEYKVKIACQYKATSLLKSNYEFLKNKNDNSDLLVMAVFNEVSKTYEISAVKHQELVDRCKELMLSKKLVFTGMNASINSVFSNFYPIKDLGHSILSSQFADAKKLYEAYTSSVILNSDITQVPDKESKNFLDKLEFIADKSENTSPNFFISNNVAKDFPRSNIIIRDSKNDIIYKQINREVTIGKQAPKTYNQTQEINYSLEPLNILENEINKNNEYDPTTLRKYIALIFHTRMQGFEQPALQDIHNHFSLDPSLIFMIANASLRTEHLIKINGINVESETRFYYLIKFHDGNAEFPLGLIESKRTVTFNLKTGKFGSESILLKKI